MPILKVEPIRKFKAPPHYQAEPFSPPKGPIDLEIGAGTGLHALRYALENPERHLIALERTSIRFAKMKRRWERSGAPENLAVFRADAQWWLPHRLPESPLDRIFLFYPNPYPKASQANHRWHRSPFMGYLLKRLSLEGCLTLTTNIPSYFEEACLYFSEYWGLSLKKFQIPPDSPPRTHFEKKYLQRGEACFELQAEKATPQSPPSQTETGSRL